MYKTEKEILKEMLIMEPTSATGEKEDLTNEEWKTVCKLFGFGAKPEEIDRIVIDTGATIMIGKPNVEE